MLIPFWTDYDEDSNTIYKFVFTSDTSERFEPYIVEIKIDELNDSLVLSETCTCKGFYQFHKTCKHIKAAREILKHYKVQMRYENGKESMVG